ncbi:MAG: type II toxin-antitoxin system VapC family toxin [Solirubrobacterales bacterium]
MVVVDTSVWVDLYRDRESAQVEALKTLLRGESTVALTDVVYMEVLQGALSDRDQQTLEAHLSKFPILRLLRLDDFKAAADLYRTARAVGVTVRSSLDLLIAAACLRAEAQLLHSDADFDRLASCTPLRIYEPAA